MQNHANRNWWPFNETPFWLLFKASGPFSRLLLPRLVNWFSKKILFHVVPIRELTNHFKQIFDSFTDRWKFYLMSFMLLFFNFITFFVKFLLLQSFFHRNQEAMVIKISQALVSLYIPPRYFYFLVPERVFLLTWKPGTEIRRF